MKISKFFLFSFFFFLCISYSLIFVSAQQQTIGVGLYYTQESFIVLESTEKCVDYGLYNNNPGYTTLDVMAYLEPTGGLANLSEKTEPILVPKDTPSKDALPVKLCFDIPKTYKEECILGLFCERKCLEKGQEVIYSGGVVATYILPEGIGGTGSRTGSSIEAPLAFGITCEPKQRNTVAMYITFAVLIIALAVIIWLLVRAKKKKKSK